MRFQIICYNMDSDGEKSEIENNKSDKLAEVVGLVMQIYYLPDGTLYHET